MKVWVRWRKLFVRAWSAAFGRQAALAARDGVWDALGLLRHNRDQSDETLERLEDLARRLERLERSQARHEAQQQGLAHRIRDAATPLYGTILAAKTRAGLTICVDGRDGDEAATILAEGVVAPGLDRLLTKLLPPGGAFVEVGARFGYYSMLAARLVGPQGRVFCLEANPEHAALIARSARANDFVARVKVFARAASDGDGKAKFVFDPFASASARLAEAHAEATEVETARLDDLLEPGFVADVVKLDAPGREMAALRGMAGLLQRSPAVKLIVDHAPAPGGEAAVDLVDELAALGLSVWRVGRAGFLLDVVREELLRDGPMRLLAARRRPQDREIRWEAAALRAAGDGSGALDQTGIGFDWPLAAGRYEVSVEGDVGGAWELIATQEGDLPLARRRIDGAGQGLALSLADDVRRFSVALAAASPQASLRLERIVVRDLTPD